MEILKRRRNSTDSNSGLHLLSLLAIFTLLSACATSRAKIYPNFRAQRQNINSLTIFCDYFVVDDVKGKTDLADVPRNIGLAGDAMDLMEKHISGKGFQIVGKHLISMGLYAKETTRTYKIAADKSPVGREEINALPEGPPPFYVNKALLDSDEKAEDMSAVTKALAKYSKKKANQPATTIPEATKIQTGANEDGYLFMFIQGRDVALGKTMGQAVATAVLTLGMFSIAQVSHVTIYYYIVDAKTGEVIWSDSSYGKGAKPSNTKFLAKCFKRLAKNIPAK